MLICLVFSAIRDVSKSVARIIALALDLKIDFFDEPEMLGKPIATLRLLHYGGWESQFGHFKTSFELMMLIIWN